jgi:hypothetical protein
MNAVHERVAQRGEPRLDTLRITVGRFSYVARLEREAAPQTCAAFLTLLPFKQ